MKKKVGPLQLWQWGAIVGSGLGLYLLLHHKKAEAGEPGPSLVGSTNNPLAGFGGGGTEGSFKPLEGIPGLVGEPGPAGVAGVTPDTLTPNQIAEVDSILASKNNPPTAKSRKSAKAIAKRKHPHKGVKHPASKTKKGHQEAHHQAHKEHRSTVHPAKGEHSAKHAAAVAPRAHGKPSPLHVHHPQPKPLTHAGRVPLKPHHKRRRVR